MSSGHNVVGVDVSHPIAGNRAARPSSDLCTPACCGRRTPGRHGDRQPSQSRTPHFSSPTTSTLLECLNQRLGSESLTTSDLPDMLRQSPVRRLPLSVCTVVGTGKWQQHDSPRNLALNQPTSVIQEHDCSWDPGKNQQLLYSGGSRVCAPRYKKHGKASGACS